MTLIPFNQSVIPGLSFDMVFIPGGTFHMGSDKSVDPDAGDDESPVHEVKVSDFYMGRYPVTQDIWDAVMENNPSYFKGPRRPVERVSWEEAQAFIEQLNALTNESRLQGYQYRLPTEAEWEYAARGGPYARSGECYAGSDAMKEIGWSNKNSHSETKPVGMKLPNALGLYDMSGNVDEWCEDWLDEKFYTECAEEGLVVDPCNQKEGADRANRGGGWFSAAKDCRSAYRGGWYSGDRGNDLGFRLVLAPQ